MSGIAAKDVADLLRLTAGRRGSRVALVSGERRLTWHEVDVETAAVSAGLLALGLAAGDRVGLVMHNVPEFVTSFVGVVGAGLVAVPLDPVSAPGELARRFSDAVIRVVIADAESTEVVRRAVAAVEGSRPRLVTLAAGQVASEEDELGWADLLAAGEGRALPEIETDDEDLAVLLYTSGTSGRPGAVMLSHRAMLATVEKLLELNPPPIGPEDVVLGALPMTHVYGLVGVLGPSLATGATVILTSHFQPDETLRLIHSEGITSVPAAPQMLLAWTAMDALGPAFASVRVLISGGAPLPVAVAEEIETATGLPVHEGYGLTETASAVTTSLASPKHKTGSVGRPLSGVELRVVDEDEVDVAGTDAAGDPGQILIRSSNLFSGYWPDGRGAPDPDGWWHSGDVGYLDADGDLFLVDRIKDVILVSGFNVYPREVEEVLEEHPAIARAAVVGMPHPRTGETVKAFVVPRSGALLDTAEVVAWSRERLARFKCPTIVSVVPELPHSTIGKIRRGELR